MKAEKARADACRADLLRREKLYEAALKRCARPTSRWRYWVSAGIGAVVAGGLCIGTAAAIK